MRQLWASPWAPTITLVLFHSAILALHLCRLHAGTSALVVVDTKFADRDAYQAITKFWPHGYDGQYYYVLAQEPWTPQPERLDLPARHLRIFYPVVCYLISGGNADILLLVMPAVNLLALGLLVWVGACWAVETGTSVWWAALLPFATHAMLPLVRDLPDLTATAALVGLLVSWLARHRSWVIALWALIAVFAREQNVAIAAIVLVAAVRERHSAAIGITLVLAAWVSWVAMVWIAYDRLPFLPAQGNSGLPFAALIQRFTDLQNVEFWTTGSRAYIRVALTAAAVQVSLIPIGLYLAMRQKDLAIRLTILAGIGLAAVAGWEIYRDIWSFGRTLTFLPMAAWFAMVHLRARWLIPLYLVSVYTCIAVIRV